MFNIKFIDLNTSTNINIILYYIKLYYIQQWLRYQAHNKPHLFFSGFIAFLGPVFLFAGTPLRRTFLYADATPLPLDGYPVPNRARSSPAGYED